MRRHHVFVVPFLFENGRLMAVEPQPARSVDGAIYRAEAIAKHFAGVAVYGVMVDDVTFDANDLCELARFGQVLEREEIAQAA